MGSSIVVLNLGIALFILLHERWNLPVLMHSSVMQTFGPGNEEKNTTILTVP